MPVTAKLSRKVYQRLGDDVVNAIVDWFNQVDATYNADLREMNDLNFARFDAKVGERLTQFESRIDRRFAEFEARVDGRLADIDGRLVALEARVEGRLAALEIRLTRRVYIASTATFLAQIVALATLFRIFVAR